MLLDSIGSTVVVLGFMSLGSICGGYDIDQMVARLDQERDVLEGKRHLKERERERERERGQEWGREKKKKNLNKKWSSLIFYWIKLIIWSAKWSSLNFAF